MPKNLYIDESVRKSYVLTLIIIDEKDIKQLKRNLHNLKRFINSSIHMYNLNKSLRKTILNDVLNYNLEVIIIEDVSFKNRKTLSRQICLREAFKFISEIGRAHV